MTSAKRTSTPVRLCIIVPCYNEEAVLPDSSQKLEKELQALITENDILDTSCILFVDDGSQDATWQLLSNLHNHDSAHIKALRFAHNAGHQNALLAGIDWAHTHQFDCSISIDADLQDDIHAIRKMVKKYQEGFEIVNGVRDHRASDTVFKRTSAKLFYQLMNLLGAHTIPNSADFRLLGKRAMNALALYREKNVFLRGLVPELGFSSCNVTYTRLPRLAGETKYPLHKMLHFALDGITSFSVVPIRIVDCFGFVSLLIACVILIYSLVRLAAGDTVTGWASLILSIWFLGGLVMLALGIVGEYIARIYLETKDRPRYIIEEELDSTL